jgi:hypothetical protein
MSILMAQTASTPTNSIPRTKHSQLQPTTHASQGVTWATLVVLWAGALPSSSAMGGPWSRWQYGKRMPSARPLHHLQAGLHLRAQRVQQQAHLLLDAQLMGPHCAALCCRPLPRVECQRRQRRRLLRGVVPVKVFSRVCLPWRAFSAGWGVGDPAHGAARPHGAAVARWKVVPPR